MAAANAQIGVATAAYYPSIILTPSVGLESRSLATLFDAPSLIWSLGTTITQPLFSGGRITANVDFARANYDAVVAAYRRTVLTAMQEVEDGITGLSALEVADMQARTARRHRAPCARPRQRALRRRRHDLPRRHHRTAVGADGRAAGRRRVVGQRLLVTVFLVKGASAATGQRPARLAGG